MYSMSRTLSLKTLLPKRETMSQQNLSKKTCSLLYYGLLATNSSVSNIAPRAFRNCGRHCSQISRFSGIVGILDAKDIFLIGSLSISTCLCFDYSSSNCFPILPKVLNEFFEVPAEDSNSRRYYVLRSNFQILINTFCKTVSCVSSSNFCINLRTQAGVRLTCGLRGP